MIENFASGNVSDLKKYLDLDKFILVSRAFYDGDHWQDGRGWVGPYPADGDDGFDVAVQEIQDGFVSRNVIAEVIERHTTAIFGREPTWTFVPRRPMKPGEEPNDEEKFLIEEVEHLIGSWWEDKKIHSIMMDSISTLLYGKRSNLRLYVPRGLLVNAVRGDGVEVKVIKANDIEDGLKKVFLGHPHVENAVVHVDIDTMRDYGIYVSKDENDKEIVEITFLNDIGSTVFRMVTDDSDNTYFADFGGRITMYQMDRKLLITEQMQQMQRALNLCLSVLPRNIVTGGFLERILLNAQMPGTWETDDEGKRKKFIPDKFHTGAGTTNFVRGLDYQDVEGNTLITTPNVQFRDPIEVRPTIEGARAIYLDMLEEGKQSHILANSSEYTSGKSREQARADFINSLKMTDGPVVNSGRWVIETALAMAEAFSGQPGKYTKKLRVAFTCKPDYGPLTADEKRQLIETMEKEVYSKERVSYYLGVDDPAAEQAQINREREARPKEELNNQDGQNNNNQV